MTAEKMFEEMGYHVAYSGSQDILKYSVNYYSIVFNKSYKTVSATSDNTEAMEVDMKELEAIIQQCKEFGWI